jgi:hypothetical protein
MTLVVLLQIGQTLGLLAQKENRPFRERLSAAGTGKRGRWPVIIQADLSLPKKGWRVNQRFLAVFFHKMGKRWMINHQFGRENAAISGRRKERRVLQSGMSVPISYGNCRKFYGLQLKDFALQ